MERLGHRKESFYPLKKHKGGLIMKRFGLCIALICVCLVCSIVFSESFDPSQYSYEELVAIRDKTDEVIREMDRQYAIEHGDRTIKFEQDSYLVYMKNPIKLVPAVEKVLETAPDKTLLVWESSDETVVKAANGTITPVSTGKATVTARATDNELIFGSCEIQVINAVAKVTAAETAHTLQLNVPENSKKTLAVEITPEDAYYQEIKWSSSDENVVDVDEKGQIKAVGLGKAKVVAVTEDPFKYGTVPQATFNITVVNAVTGIELANNSMLLGKGSIQSIDYKIVPEDATNQKLEIVSSNPAVAAVGQGGKISGKSGGECDITLKAMDGSEVSTTFHVKVEQLVKSISIAPNKLSARVSSTEKLTCTVAPADANNKQVRWYSTKTSVAKVSASGVVTPVAGGDCEIVCEAKDGSGVQARIKVHVPSFHLNKTEYTVTSKNGLDIPVYWDKNGSLYLNYTSVYFTGEWTEDHKIHIDPIKAGSGTVTVYFENEKQDALKIKVNIKSSAVYDQNSYPIARYEDALRYPNSYKNRNMSIKGRVLQISTSGRQTVLRVGTGGYASYDKVFWVEYDNTKITTPIIEDDRIVVYGKGTGTETYTTIMGASITIPSVDAEKIIIGK